MSKALLPGPVHDLTRAVVHQLDRTRASLPDLRRAADRLSRTPGLLGRALADLRSDRAATAAVARRSYWHDNGFAKVVLHSGDGHSLRLHVWPADRPRTGDAHPHGHRWEFASWVVAGALREAVFVEIDAAEEAAPGGATAGLRYDRCAYGRDPNGSGYLRYSGATALAAVDERVRTTGTVYECSRAVVHTVAPIGTGMIATVVVQGPVMIESTPVYLRPGSPPQNRAEPLQPGQLDPLLGVVIEAAR